MRATAILLLIAAVMIAATVVGSQRLYDAYLEHRQLQAHYMGKHTFETVEELAELKRVMGRDDVSILRYKEYDSSFPIVVTFLFSGPPNIDAPWADSYWEGWTDSGELSGLVAMATVGGILSLVVLAVAANAAPVTRSNNG